MTSDANKQLRILIVEDSEDDALLLLMELQKGGYTIDYERVETRERMSEALQRREWDIVISDYVMPRFTGIEALRLYKETGLDAPFFIVSGNIGEDVAVDAMRAGAHDYIVKGKLARLIPAVSRELRDAEIRRERQQSEADRKEGESREALNNSLLALFAQKMTKQEYLDAAVHVIVAWMGCKYGGIRILGENGNVPYAAAVQFSESFLTSENLLSLLCDECACTRVIAEKPEPQDRPAMTTRGSFYTNDSRSFVAGLDTAEQSRFRGVCVKSGFMSIAIIPIRYRDKVYGAIHIADERKDMVPLKKVEVLEHMGFIIGEAMYRFSVEEDLISQREELVRMNEQLRNLSAHVDAVREAERMSIAREIHDELGQLLTAIKMDISWLRKRLAVSQKALAGKAGESVQMIDAAIQSVKRISAELRPGILDDIGLAAALEWAAKDFEKRTRIPCGVTISPESISVDRTRSTALFRILQESLTNIIRHARATEVRVSLEEKDRKIVLTVSDNGKGIKKEELFAPHSFGLIGMRERVQFLGGQMTIGGANNRGTVVTVELPIDSKKERQPDSPVQRAEQ